MPSIQAQARRHFAVRRKIAVLLSVLALIAVCYKPLLQFIAWPLIVNQEGRAAAYVAILGTHSLPDCSFAEAARACNKGRAPGIILVGCGASRLVRIGVLPSFMELSHHDLTTLGVTEDAIVEIESDAGDAWQSVRDLGRWMADRPNARVLLLCDQFSSRYFRYVIDCALIKSVSGRIGVQALKDPRFDEANWWRTREGVKRFAYAYLSLGFALMYGESANSAADDWDPDEYELSLRKRWGNAG